MCFCRFPASWCRTGERLAWVGHVAEESCAVCGAGLCSLVSAWQPLAAAWGIPAHPTWLWEVIAFRTREAAGEGGCWKAEGQTARGSARRGARHWHSVAGGRRGVVLGVPGGQRCSPTPHDPAALGRVSLTCRRGSTQPNTPGLGFLSPNDGLHCCMCQHLADAALLPALSSALQSAEALITVC